MPKQIDRAALRVEAKRFERAQALFRKEHAAYIAGGRHADVIAYERAGKALRNAAIRFASASAEWLRATDPFQERA